MGLTQSKELMLFAKSVEVRDVGLRDGLQSQFTTVPTSTKIAILNTLIEAGFKKLDVASFVHPKAMPHMADAEEVVKAIPPKADVLCSALVLNLRGLKRAIEIRRNTGQPRAVNFLMVTTQSMVDANRFEKSLTDHFRDIKEMVRTAKHEGFQVITFVSGAFGCSIEGAVEESVALGYAEELRESGADEVVISDSTGQASPVQVYRMFSKVKERLAGTPIIAHFHDTRGSGLANVLALLQVGIEPLTIDAAFGGLGGDIPFVPEAAGNIATEDLICMLDGMGVRTGINGNKVIECSKLVEEVYGKICPARSLRVGPVKWRQSP